MHTAHAAGWGVGAIDTNPPQAAHAVNVGQSSPVTPLVAADLLSAHQQYAAALAAYQKIEPKTAYIYNKIGIVYERQMMDSDAAFNFREAIKADRKYAAAYNNLGTVYFHQGDRRGVQRMYKTAIRLDGKSASYWSNLGALAISRKDHKDAIEYYQHAYKLNPEIFDEIALNGIRQLGAPEDVATIDLCFAEVYAQAGQKAAALEYPHKALLAGLHDRQKIENDSQLASLRGMPEFEQLFAKPPAR